ncbi:MAG: NAD-dependent malic enzyme, partial [Acidimicrobiales bacterium]
RHPRRTPTDPSRFRPGMPVDYVYRIEQPHVPGQLATVCATIAEANGLIGDIVAITIGRERSIREISVEVRDHGQAERVGELLGALPGVRVISFHDRAIRAHEGGMLAIEVTRPVRTLQDVRDVYTPGVARVCAAIAEDPALANRYTMIGRTVAICTNGTRVLGLGDIGPVASMPVMEGKALFYRQMVGLSAMPILIDARDADTFVETVLRIAGGFGGIHLEDIRAPECFDIEARLIDALDKPVMHDDVHGTAVAALAAVLGACQHVGIDLSDATVGQLGLGAAGFGIASLMVDAGARAVLASDPDEASHKRAHQRRIDVRPFEQVMRGAQIVVATTGRAGLITPDLVQRGQVILALTNPDPEITVGAALAAGAVFAADGTVVNNVLGFPGIFRGALAAGARRISTGMKLAAASTIAGLAEQSELVPDVLDPHVHAEVARAVEQAARDEGLARPDRVPAGL